LSVHTHGGIGGALIDVVTHGTFRVDQIAHSTGALVAARQVLAGAVAPAGVALSAFVDVRAAAVSLCIKAGKTATGEAPKQILAARVCGAVGVCSLALIDVLTGEAVVRPLKALVAFTDGL
jgi:hypothetical protein